MDPHECVGTDTRAVGTALGDREAYFKGVLIASAGASRPQGHVAPFMRTFLFASVCWRKMAAGDTGYVTHRFCLAARTSQSPKVARWLTCTLLKFAAKIDPWPIPCPPTLRVPPSRTPCTFLASHLRSYSCDSGHFHDVSVRIRAIMRSLGRSFPFRVRSLMYAILFKFFDWPSGSCTADILATA